MNKPPSFQIRPARPGDEETILSLIRDLAEYERLAHEVVATAADLTRTLFGVQHFAECLLAEVDGESAGFAIFFHNYSTFLAKPGIYLEDLFVRPRFRGTGIGKQLLKRLAKIAVERKCGRLDWSVLTWNEPAIQFYEKIGAKRMEDWVGYRLTGEALGKFAH
jgi:GNAT superfamily N-acetyltransferase